MKVDLNKISFTMVPTPYLHHFIAELDIDGFKCELEFPPKQSYLHPMVQLGRKRDLSKPPEIMYNSERASVLCVLPKPMSVEQAVKRPGELLENQQRKAAKLG